MKKVPGSAVSGCAMDGHQAAAAVEAEGETGAVAECEVELLRVGMVLTDSKISGMFFFIATLPFVAPSEGITDAVAAGHERCVG